MNSIIENTDMNQNNGVQYQIQKQYIQKYRASEKGKQKNRECQKRHYEKVKKELEKYRQIQKLTS